MAFTDRLHNRGSVSTGFNIDNSTLIDFTRNDYLTRTHSDGNRTTGTISIWIKRGRLGQLGFIWELGDADSLNGRLFARFQTDDKLRIATGTSTLLETNRLFRDVGAWYHIVLTVDTGNSTAGDRVRLYVNGERETSFGTTNNVNQNENLGIGNGRTVMGRSQIDNAHSFDGYMTEFNYMDGTAYAADQFGEFNDEGEWIPLDISTGWGTQGCRLEMQTGSAPGDDTSGNGNDFTSNGLDATNQATDTPTNNFCVWNYNDTTMAEFGHSSGSPSGFTAGNLLRQGASSAYNPCVGTFGIDITSTSSIWYWEFQSQTNIASSRNPAEGTIGWVGEDSLFTYAISNPTNNIKNTGTTRYLSDYFSGAGADVVMGVLLDCSTSNKKIKIYNNDTLVYPKENLSGGPLFFPMVSPYGSSAEFVANFGGTQIQEWGGTNSNNDPNGYGNFRFSTKSGYALCTKNLAELG